MDKLNELKTFIDDHARRSGYIVLDISLKGRGGASIDIILDKPGGITLEECSSFNREVFAWLEEKGPSYGDHAIDVSSPGLDRILQSNADFEWAVGKRVRINVSGDQGEKTQYEGDLRFSGPVTVVVTLTEGKDVEIDRKKILKARLLPDI